MQHLVAGALSLLNWKIQVVLTWFVLIDLEKIKIASFHFCASDREN